MKCVIAGSRSIKSYDLVYQAFTNCDWSSKITEIVSGTAKGVDRLGEELASNLGLEVAKFPANWSLGRGAGHIRNGDMAKYTDIAIVLIENDSNGSKNMVKQMKKLNKPCIVFIVKDGEVYESN